MDELRELYQNLIMDHQKRPRNFKVLEGATHQAEGHNPLCGDRVTVYLLVRDDRIQEVSFQGQGCAICTASASLMTEALRGKPTSEANALFGEFHDVVTTGQAEATVRDSLGKLVAFQGVSEFPVRVKCATLPWHTFQAALKGSGEVISTE
jgi:nitrogen fixation NifU-like protein